MRYQGLKAAGMAAVIMSAACSPARMGMNRMASVLTETAAAYARDDDPDFVRAGAPATLKMVEMLLENAPEHPSLLLSACSGFAQYAYAFLQVDADVLATTDARAAAELRARAGKMYARARGYCVRVLGVRQRALAEALSGRHSEALRLLERTSAPDVPALYWAALSWAGELSLSETQLLRLEELAVVRRLLTRALELEEGWSAGAVHEAMIAIEGLPRLMGGSPARARKHLERAVALSGGGSASAYVTFAVAVCVPAGDRRAFERTLAAALAVDVSARPEMRLSNIVAQRRARFLLEHAGAVFK